MVLKEENNHQPLPRDLDSPVEVLEREKRKKTEEHAAEMRLLEQAINRLKGSGNGHSPIVAGMFVGLSIKDAMTVYLNLRGGKAAIPEIIDALEQGGCETGTYPERNIGIAIGSNGKLFKRDKQTNSVVLLKGK